jgi:farnesyl diphosphate synthase
MDNDTMRRGRPTLHTVVGDGIAILAGDALHAEAFTLLAREPAPGLELGQGQGRDSAGPVGSRDGLELARRQLRVARLVGEAAGPAGMVGGQAVDLQAAGQARGGTLALDVNDLKAMHARKTGALIRASAVSGAIMAGAPDEIVGAIDRYAGDVGLGFQIVDDILDVEGDLAELGKTAGKDAAGDKPTYPKFYGVEQSRRLAMECVNRALQTLSDANLTGGHLGAIAEWVIARRS